MSCLFCGCCCFSSSSSSYSLSSSFRGIYAPDEMFQKLASECFEAVDWNAEASGDELEQPSSSLVVKHRHGPPEPLKVPPEPLKVPPEPLHDRRLRAACLQSSVATPVFNVDAAHAAHHYLPVTST